jgi:hypothetical protein
MILPERRLDVRYRAEERDAGWYVQQQLSPQAHRTGRWQDVLGPVDRGVAEQEAWLRQRLVELIRRERDRHDVA